MTKNYIKRLKKFTPDFQDIFIDTLSQIEKRDFTGLDIVKLQGKDGYFRCRVGKFRIIFHQDEAGEYIVDDIGSRGDIYK